MGLEADASETGKELGGQEVRSKRKQGGRRAIGGRDLSDEVTDPGGELGPRTEEAKRRACGSAYASALPFAKPASPFPSLRNGGSTETN